MITDEEKKPKVLSTEELLKRFNAEKAGTPGAVNEDLDPWGHRMVDPDSLLAGKPKRPQVPQAKPVAEVAPAAGTEKKQGYWEGLGRKLMASGASLGDMAMSSLQGAEALVNSPMVTLTEMMVNRQYKRGEIDEETKNYLIKEAAEIAPKIGRYQPTAAYTPTIGEKINESKVGQAFENDAQAWSESVARHDKTASQYLKSGQFGKALEAVSYGIAESLAPTLAAAFVPGGAAVLGVGTAGQTFDDVKDREDMYYGQKVADAVTVGMFEWLFERFGSREMGKALMDIYQKSGKEGVVKAFTSPATKNLIAKAYKKFGVWFAPVHEGISEGLTTLGQNAAAILSGEDPEREIQDGFWDSVLIGAGMGGMFSLTEKTAEMYRTAREGKAGPITGPLTIEDQDPEVMIRDLGKKYAYNGFNSELPDQNFIKYGEMKDGRKVIIKSTNFATDPADMLVTIVDAENPESKPEMTKGNMINNSMDVPYEQWVQNEMRNYQATMSQISNETAKATAPVQEGATIPIGEQLFNVTQVTDQGIVLNEIDKEGNLTANTQTITPDQYGKVFGVGPAENEAPMPQDGVQQPNLTTGQPAAPAQPTEVSQQSRKVSDGKNEFTIIPQEDGNFRMSESFETQKEAETALKKLQERYPKLTWKAEMTDSGDLFTPDTYTIVAEPKQKPAAPVAESPKIKPEQKPVEAPAAAPEVKAEAVQPIAETPSTPDETAAEEEVQNAGEVETQTPKGVPTYAQKKQIVLDHFGGMYEDAAASTPEQIYEQVPEVTPEDARQIHAEIKSEFEAEQEKAPPEVAVAKAEGQVDLRPTEAEKKAGNYAKGHLNFKGFDISIENPAGSVRSGVSKDGKKWSNLMNNTYGYFRRTEGKDGDQVDVFLGDNLDSDAVYVVDQVDPETGVFDEHKTMLGFNSAESARENYLANYEPGWKGLGSITKMSMEGFKEWLGDAKRTRKPVDGNVPVKEKEEKPKITTDEIKNGPKPAPASKPQKPTEDTRPIKKLKEKKGWPMSKADEARLSREPQSFEEAVYQFFIGRGRISTASLKHHLGTRSREDYASYIWAHKKDGQKTDKLNEAHIFQAHPELLKQTGDQQDQERAFMDILLSVHGLNDMRTRIDEMQRKADEINAEPVAPEAEEEIDYIDAGQVVDEEILPLEEEDPEILRIFELEINELGRTLDDLKNLAANDPDYFQVFPYGLNEKQFNELKSILNDTERQKQIIGLDHEVNQSESRSQGDNEVPGSPEPESRTDGEGREEGGTEESFGEFPAYEREIHAIEEWLPDSEHSDYISYEWDGQTLEIFKGRDERIVGLSRDQLIEEGVKFPEVIAPALSRPEFAGEFFEQPQLTFEEKISKATELGAAAFAKGAKRVPAQDKDLVELTSGVPVGKATPILEAWIKAWDKANLAQPIGVEPVKAIWQMTKQDFAYSPLRYDTMPTTDGSGIFRTEENSDGTWNAWTEMPDGTKDYWTRGGSAGEAWDGGKRKTAYMNQEADAKSMDRHREAVIQALNEGKEVPEDVLRNYIGLKDYLEKQKKKEAAKPKEKESPIPAKYREQVDNLKALVNKESEGLDANRRIAEINAIESPTKAQIKERNQLRLILENTREEIARRNDRVDYDIIPENKAREIRKLIEEARAQDEAIGQRILRLQDERDAKEKSLQKRAGLFGDRKEEEERKGGMQPMFAGEIFEASSENLQSALKPFNDAIKKAEEEWKRNAQLLDEKIALVLKVAQTKMQMEPPVEPVKPTYGTQNTVFTEDAAAKAREILRKKFGNLSVGIDPETMQAGITLAGYHIEAGARKFADYTKAMIADLGEAIKPYLKSFYNAVRDWPGFDPQGMDDYGTVSSADIDKIVTESIANSNKISNLDKGNNTQGDVHDRSRGSQSDSSDSTDEVSGDEGSLSDEGRGRGSVGDESKGGNRPKSRRGGRTGGSGLFTPLFGESGDNEVHPEEQSPEPADDDAGDFDGRGNGLFGPAGSDLFDQGTDTESDTDGERVSVSFQEKTRLRKIAQRKAESIPIKLRDEENIRATLPVLLPEQQDDVIKAENRFFGEQHKTRELAYGKGMLFTNGTGTGKTFTGLGIIKRFAKSGKKNILIVVPSEAKKKDWISDGENLMLSITELKDTKDIGKGIRVTTYAAFRANDNLKNVDFDLIVYDESHRLMEEKSGNASATTQAHYELANIDERYAFQRLTSVHPLWIKAKNLDQLIRADSRSTNNLDLMDFQLFEIQERIKKNEEELKKVEAEQREVEPSLRERAQKAYQNTKVVYLSATPFKGHFNLRYANKTLFDWGDETTYEQASRGMSRVDPESRFFLDNFGSAYEWKYHRLQSKSKANAEAIAMQEVAFAEKLMSQGVMSGRAIESDMDYSREFPMVALDKTEIFNQAFTDIFTYGEAATYPKLTGAASEVFFNYNYTTQLLESLRASMTIPRIRKHLSMGRKVVVFHRRKQANVTPPFANILQVARNTANTVLGDKYRSEKEKEGARETLRQADLFEDNHRELLEYEQTLTYSPATDQILAEFGQDRVGFINGDISKREKVDNIRRFNDDDSGLDVIVVQEEAGKEGISLHDTTGKHQRVMMSLSLPISSTTALQMEGRIYRIGQETDAIFENPILGLDMEIADFGQKINRKLSTTENLAIGNQARDLIRSFAEGVIFNAKKDDPNTDQGKGGKEYDKKAQKELNEFRRAVLVYNSNQKNRGRRDQREGTDYFATPEPLGQKMVEWLDLKPGDSALEPSAGHGAIAMWFPESVSSTSIEPSYSLFAKLNARAGGGNRKVVRSTFEDFSIVNKFNGIAMNPPFGAGGKLAIEHIEKAFGHLRNGGRIVAIIPDGPSMEKRFDNFLYGTDEDGKYLHPDAHLTATIKLPRITFEQAGTSVASRVVVIDRIEKKSLESIKKEINAENLESVMKGGFFLTREELEAEAQKRFKNQEEIDAPYQRDIELNDVKTIDEFFDEIEDITLSSRVVLAEQAASTASVPAPEVKPGEIAQIIEQKHSKTGATLYTVHLTERVSSEVFNKYRDSAKAMGGSWSSYAKEGIKPGFMFNTLAEATKFHTAITSGENDVSLPHEPTSKYTTSPVSSLEEMLDGYNTLEDRRQAIRRAADDATQLTIDYSGVRRADPVYPKIKPRTVLEDFKESGYVDVIGRKIDGPQDIADIWSIHRSPYIEKVHVIFVKDGRVVGTTASTLNQIHSGPSPDSAIIMDLYKKWGADGIYLLHNHPSGNHRASASDVSITTRIKNDTKDAGVNLIGHVIIDTNKFSFIDVNTYPAPENAKFTFELDNYILDNVLEFEYKNPAPRLFSERESIIPPGEKGGSAERMMEIAIALLKDRGYTGASVYLSRNMEITAYDPFPAGATNIGIIARARASLNSNLGSSVIFIHDGSHPTLRYEKLPKATLDLIDTQWHKSEYFETLQDDTMGVYKFEKSLWEAGPEGVIEGIPARNSELHESQGKYDTREFKAWFGNSKVVDDNGNPLVMYHGTAGKFDVFDIAKRSTGLDSNGNGDWGNGFYFTPNKELAGDIAEGLAEDKEGNANVMSVFLKMENPLDFRKFNVNQKDFEGTEEEYNFMDDILGDLGDNWGDWDIAGKAKAAGYDGIISMDGQEYIVFEPSQIKSATGNIGTFNPNDPNILKDSSGHYRRRPLALDFEYAGDFMDATATYNRSRKQAAAKRKDTVLSKAAQAYEEKKAIRTGEETIQGIREYIQDLSLPIRRFEEELLRRGGKQDNTSKPYRDMSLSFGRQEKLYNDYFEGNMKPILQAVADIKRAGMKGEDILPYIIAKHAMERNPAFRSRELKEWVESHKENVPQDEVNAKMEELKDKDYSGVMGFDTDKTYTNPDELARDIVSEFEGKVDAKLINNLWNKIGAATSEILDTWQRGHQITPEQKQEYLSQFRYFVPLRGWREGAAKELVYTKGEGFSRSLQYAKGRKSLADNPLAYLLNVQFQAIAEQVDNEVKTSMVNLIIKNLSNNEMHEMATIKKLYYVKITLPDGTEEWEPTTTRPPQEMFDAGDAKTKIYSEHERLRKPRQAREHEVYVRKPGGDMVMVFNGKHLSTAQAMNKQNYMYRTIFGNIYDARDLNKVMALMGHVNNMLKALYTSWNVVFPFTNFLRDEPEATITGYIKEGKKGLRVPLNNKSAFPALLRRMAGKQNLKFETDRRLEEFYTIGAATGYTHMKSPEEIEKDINKEIARMVRKGSVAGRIGDAGHTLLKAVEHWNKIFEDATRFSVYLNSLALGYTKEDAAYEAKEASVNFNRKGKGSKAWDAWFAFFNVAVQSMQKNFKLAKDYPGRFSKVAFSYVMLGFLEALMNALTDDEDDPDSSYYNINPYMRQNYLVIPLPQIGNLRKKGNKYLSIPLPQFWRGFKSIGSIGFDVATGRMKAGEAVTTALGNFAGGLLPIDVGGFYKSGEFSVAPLVPTITKPVVELIENRNYMGYTIKKEPFTREQAKYLADAGLGKDNVNPAAKFFTDMLFRWSGGDSRYKYYTDKQGRTRKVLLDVNPSTVEHLFKGYTGGTGSVVSDLMTTVSQVLDKEQEIDFRNTPFVNKFLRNTPEHKWQIISEFYDLKEANDRDITLMKEYERQGRQTGNTSQYERMAEDEYRIERKMIFDSYEDQISDLTKGVTKDDMESSSLVIEQMDMCIGEIKRLEARYKRKY